jgi:hypothetical protein
MRSASLPCVLLLALLIGCQRSHFEPAQLLGRAAMVDDDGRPRLWVFTKQEEVRRVGIRPGGINSRSGWHSETMFHFDLQAFDPVTATSLWTRRVLTIGDPDGMGRVIGSDVDARMLGQDSAFVWLLLDDQPLALHAADGSLALNAAMLQQLNPSLQGRLPSEARFYGFDRGLVITTADAQQFVVRGGDHTATPYTPPLRVEPEAPRKANGMPELVPLLPPGDVPARHVTLRGQRLALYSDKEAADASIDEWGRKLRWPYTVLNEGRMARRTLRTMTVVNAQRFEDRFERIATFSPARNTETYLNGRFAKDPRTGAAQVLEAPQGVLVWHSTRIDDAGRVALTRLDADLAPRWRVELPLSESNMTRPLATWWLPGYLVVVGTQQVVDEGVTMQVPYLVSVELVSGRLQSARLTE